jgi:hypothetical protein
MKRLILCIVIVLVSTGIVFAHGNKKHDDGTASTNVGYNNSILPVFEKQCSSCHGSGSPEHIVFAKNPERYTAKYTGPKMDSYSSLTSFIIWPDTGALMRNLDDGGSTLDGKPGKMYMYLGTTDQERKKNLELFKSWVGYWTLKEWSEISKEEIDRILLSP